LILSMAFRNIWRRKFRTAVTVIAIIVTAMLYSSIGSATTAISISSIKAYTDYVGDFDILVTGRGQNYFFNATPFIDNISRVDYVDAVSPRLIFGAYAAIDDHYVRLLVIGINMSYDSDIGSFKLVSGNLSLGENTCLILDTIASTNNLHPGDSLTLYHWSLTGSIIISNLTISGIIEQKGKISIDMKSVIFVSLETAQSMFRSEGLVNMIFIKLNQEIIDPYDLDSSVDRIVKVGEEIQEIIGFDYQVTLVKAQILESVSTAISFQKALLDTFASTALIMAIILVIFTITMNLNERIREIGILRALGFRKTSIFILFLTEALLLGGIGSIIGAFLGIFLSEYLFLTPIGFRRSILGRYVGAITFNPQDLIFSIVIGLVSTIIGGLYPALSATRIEPAEALSPAARRAKEISIIEKKINPEFPLLNLIYIGASMFIIFSLFMVIIPLLGSTNMPSLIFMVLFLILIVMLVSLVLIFSGIFPVIIAGLRRILKFSNKISVILANINLLRRRKRTILAFFMMATAISALLLIGIMTNTQKNSLVMSIKVNAGADIVIYSQDGLPLNVTDNISRIDGVLSVCPITGSIDVTVGDIVLWEKASVRLYGLWPVNYVESSYINDFVSGASSIFSKLQENLTVIISSGLANRLGLSTNDYLRLDLYHKTYKLKIVGVIPTAPGFRFTRFAERSTGSDILVSVNTFINITGINPMIYRIFVSVTSEDKITKVVNEISNELSESYDIQVITTQDYIDRASEGIEQLNNILSTLLDFAVFIAVLGQMASILTSIKEREWEIGVLRALGSSRSQVALIFIIESLLLTILGYLAGFLGALIAALELNYSNTLTSEIVVPISIPVEQALMTLLIILVPTLVLSIIVSYNSTRKDIAEIIRLAELQ